MNRNCKYTDSHMSCNNGVYACIWITPLCFILIYLNFTSWVDLTWFVSDVSTQWGLMICFPSSPLQYKVSTLLESHARCWMNLIYTDLIERKTQTSLTEVPSRKPLAEKMEWEKMWQDDGWSPASPPSAEVRAYALPLQSGGLRLHVFILGQRAEEWGHAADK